MKKDALKHLEYVIKSDLESFAYENAKFLAERLVAEDNCPKNVGLLAKSYMALKMPKCAIHVLQNSLSFKKAFSKRENHEFIQMNRYMLANCLYSIGEWQQSEEAMNCIELRIRGAEKWGKQLLHSSEMLLEIPNEAKGLVLLGKISEKLNRRRDAILHYSLALKFDPYRFEAFERLCKLGADIDPKCFFGSNIHGEDGANPTGSLPIPTVSGCKFVKVSNSVTKSSAENTNSSGRKLSRKVSSEKDALEPTSRKDEFKENDVGIANSSVFALKPYPPSFPAKSWPIFPNYSPKSEVVDRILIKSSLSILQLLGKIGAGINHVAMYRCKQGKKSFATLSSDQIQTFYILEQLGKSCFEMAEYDKALIYYDQMHKIQPFDTSAFDYYSTTLWHLKEDFRLSFLAQKAISIDKLCPKVWVAVGNLFSFNKEHDLALKFFQRSLQIDPDYAYAHTLSGYEVLRNEDFEKSMICFKNANKLDERLYNAFYGAGVVKLRQENFESALAYFDRALAINPFHSVLHCYRGQVFQLSGEPEAALECLDRAIQLSEKNLFALFNKGKVLMELHHYPESLETLERLAKFAPNEAEIFSLMAEVSRRLENPAESIRYLDKALKCSTRDQPKLKAQIEQIAESMEADGFGFHSN